MRLDFACDGFTFHGKRRQFELDATQRSRMAALDWLSIIATDRNLKSGSWLRDLTRALNARALQALSPDLQA